MPAMVILSTDALLWLVVLATLAYVRQARRHPHLAAPWREVRRQPLALSAAVVLVLYVAVALLDSLHFEHRAGGAQADTDVASVLDILLSRLRAGAETSYSAPLAAFAHDSQQINQPDGTVVRAYPRLQYGGRHLEDPVQDRQRDLLARGLGGAACGLAFGAVLVLPFRRRIIGARADRALRAAAFTCMTLGGLLGSVAMLAHGYHVLGTDKVGADVLYQALKSVRTGLVIGTLTTLITLPFALALGVMAGYFRGFIDDLVQYLYTTLASIPGVLLVAACALLLDGYMARHAEAYTSLVRRADLRLLMLCVILGITSWTSLCRLLRAEALKLRELDFVWAARALGSRNARILRHHLLPNVMHIVIIATVLDFSGLVLAEAALTYIEIGVDPSMESWGNMINAARLELAREPAVWWPLLGAMVSMFLLVLAANLFADAVREAFDPRTRQTTGS